MSKNLEHNIKSDINSFIRETDKSETLLLNELSRTLEASGKEVYKFGFGQSPFNPPGFVIDALKKNSHRKEYTNVQGLPELLESVAAFHNRTQAINIKPSHIVVGPGSKMLLYCILKVFTKAIIMIPTPAWVSYEPQAKLCGHKVIRLHTNYEQRWRVTPDILEKTCKEYNNSSIPIVLILNYPGNPDGLTYTKEELIELAEILKKYNVIVIADEIYSLLDHNDSHQTLAKFYPERTIVTNGLSKSCGAGGWRLGVALVAEGLGSNFRECFLGIASETYSCASTPVQWAAIEAYRNFEQLQSELVFQRKILAAVGNMCQILLSKSEVKVHPPQGGFYLYTDFSNLKDKLIGKGLATSQKLCARLLEDTGVALLPGDAFGANEGELTARLAYVDFDGAKTLQECKKISTDTPLNNDFVSSNCDKVIKGTYKLVEWLSAL